MNIKSDNNSFSVGMPRHLILDLLLKTENEWICREIPANKRNKYIRKIVFIKKDNERWKFEN